MLFSHRVLTVEQAQLQQWRQGCDDHKHEEAAAPTHQAHRWAQGHAGRHGDASHGEVVCIEVVEHGGLLGFGVHHAAGEAVVDPIASQPVMESDTWNKDIRWLVRVSGNWRERYEYLGLLVVFSEYKEKAEVQHGGRFINQTKGGEKQKETPHTLSLGSANAS